MLVINGPFGAEEKESQWVTIFHYLPMIAQQEKENIFDATSNLTTWKVMNSLISQTAWFKQFSGLSNLFFF